MARRNPVNSFEQHLPMILLIGGVVAGAYVMGSKKRAALQALSTVAPTPSMAASSAMLPAVSPDGSDPNQMVDDFNQINALMPTGSDMSGLGALRGRGRLAGLQRSGALPGMGSFHLSNVINTVINKPIQQLNSGPLKIPLAIMTMGASVGIAKAADVINAAATAAISKIDDPLMKAKQMVMSVVGGKAQAPANTAGTTITYLDCNGSVIDLPTIQSQLSALAAAGGATSITPTVDASGNAVYRMPACPPAATTYAPQPGGNPVPAPVTAAPITGAPSVATGTQYNPATGLPYPIGTPINPYTGQAYLNPSTGQPWPPYTTIDPNTGMPPGYVAPVAAAQPTMATGTQINYATGLPYPVGTPLNPATGQAYLNPATGQPWPPYTSIDPTTGMPPGYTGAATTSSTGYDGSGDGYSFTDPNVVNQAATGIDPTTGLPYGQTPAAAAAAATAAAVVPVTAPVPSKVSWLTVAGVALAVPAIMYVAHK